MFKTELEDKYNDKELTVLYHKMGVGDIAQTYNKEQEKPYYMFVCKKIADRYPNLVSANELEDLISNNGRIVTIGSVIKNGFFDCRRNVLGVGHYLDRVSTYLVHEMVHKIAFFRSEGKIENLPNVYKEAGTEIVATESTKTKDTVGYVFGNIWAKFPNTITDYYLEYALVKQLNFLTGDESIEKTILCGENCFEEKLKQLLGDKEYLSITQQISKIGKDFAEYSIYNGINSKTKNMNLKVGLLKDIAEVQNEILKIGFDQSIKNADTIEEAEEILNRLLEFSDNRIRTKTKTGFCDISFKKYFEKAVDTFSERFKGYTFKQKYNSNDWNERYTKLQDITQVSDEEKNKIAVEGKKRYKSFKGSFLSRIFGSNDNMKKALPEPTINSQVSQKDLAVAFNKSLEVKGVSVKKGSNKTKKENREEELKKSQDVK